MTRRVELIAVAIAVMALTACSRDAMRAVTSLKDSPDHAQQQSSSDTGVKSDAIEKKAVSAAAAAGGSAGNSKASIETGSVTPRDCQGEHIAYQATKEYLKNFGPKPPSEPGERGPCRRD